MGGMEPKDPQSRIPLLSLSQRMICDEQNGLSYDGGVRHALKPCAQLHFLHSTNRRLRGRHSGNRCCGRGTRLYPSGHKTILPRAWHRGIRAFSWPPPMILHLRRQQRERKSRETKEVIIRRFKGSGFGAELSDRHSHLDATYGLGRWSRAGERPCALAPRTPPPVSGRLKAHRVS